MKISAQEEYGLRCLLQLARADTMGQSLTLSQIAQLEGISSANAGKLLWILSKAGLVQSTRGTKGGYSLAKPASEIRLNKVIRVLEGEPAESHCKSYAGVLDACVHTGDCGIRPVIIELHQIVDNALADITLSQLLGTEANVDAALHHIQGMKQRDNIV
ncbi:MAG TPA: Rrf2 family transcriptional regulator [Pyrinomonadaceae bacterium]|jgi:Rrf2 family iron-sulfur cluster assembly transcriptional regulator|nr:Rrf2 family transcriptional regulator [Pyrinomonadaceae bacterium]